MLLELILRIKIVLFVMWKLEGKVDVVEELHHQAISHPIA